MNKQKFYFFSNKRLINIKANLQIELSQLEQSFQYIPINSRLAYMSVLSSINLRRKLIKEIDDILENRGVISTATKNKTENEYEQLSLFDTTEK